MDFQSLPTTPAYVFDLQIFKRNLEILANLKARSHCQALYSIKALPLMYLLTLARDYIDGFSVSSLFEARLAREVLAGQGSIHLTTPGLRANEIDELAQICTHLSFNSLGQWQRFSSDRSASWGVRINPKLSYGSDPRFDPCRFASKLGVDIHEIAQQGLPAGLEGLQCHTIFSATNFEPLLQTVKTLRQHFGETLASLKWINLGGGYLFEQINDLKPMIRLIQSLQDDYGLQVFIEPGKSMVGQAGFLISSVVDTFISDGQHIAVLDTAINHHPEVFEYQRAPDLMAHKQGAPYPTTLVGSSCLAGDIFGDYHFERPLQCSDRVVFKNVGAYSLIKANRFNGYNLPDVYTLDTEQFTLLKHYSYEEYRQQWAC